MMTADVAVARLLPVLVGRFVFEYLEIRSMAAAQEGELPHHGARMDAEMLRHPLVLGLKRAEVVEFLAADDVDEEVDRLGQVGHGEADMVGAAQPGHARLAHCAASHRLSPRSAMASARPLPISSPPTKAARSSTFDTLGEDSPP